QQGARKLEREKQQERSSTQQIPRLSLQESLQKQQRIADPLISKVEKVEEKHEAEEEYHEMEDIPEEELVNHHLPGSANGSPIPTSKLNLPTKPSVEDALEMLRQIQTTVASLEFRPENVSPMQEVQEKLRKTIQI